MLATLLLSYDDHPRRIRVHVPERVDRPAPLLVLFDGQNVFGDEGSYAGGWHADAATDQLPSTIRRPILVGVDHGGVHRIQELWQDLDRFLAFVKHQVLPAVRTRWATDPTQTVIGGSSMGGLAAFAANLRDAATFGSALVMSPSLWVDKGAVFREMRHRPVPRPSRIYLDVGQRERGVMPELAARLARELDHRGYDKQDLLWRPDRLGTHQERHWQRRLPKALKFLFRRSSAT